MPISHQFSYQSNYLALMRVRLKVNGRFNVRKLMILAALLKHGNLPARRIWGIAGSPASYSSMRATLSRLVKYKYISSHKDGSYSLVAKGFRFLFAVKELYPEVYQKVLPGYFVNIH